jgi:hypothetical protein
LADALSIENTHEIGDTMSEVRFLPAAWIAAQRRIESHAAQLDLLNNTLEQMLETGAADSVIEAILTAIDALDADTTDARNDDDERDEIADDDDTERATRKQVIAHLRSEGYTGNGFDTLVTLYHRDLAELEYLRAEGDTRGHMIRSRYQNNYSARKLWFCTERELRKYASEEMLAWFDQYGRLTRAQLRENLLGRKHYAGSGYLH